MAEGDIYIIGYGNPHRQDDRAGHAVAENVRTWAQEKECTRITVSTAYQLDLNMVDDISSAQYVLFLDAHTADYSPKVEVHDVTPHRTQNFTTHLFTAQDVIALAAELYGVTPRAWLVSIPGYAFDMGDDLSPETAAQVTRATDMVRDLLVTQCGV